MVNIYLQKLKPEKMLRDASIAVFGQRRQGKTVLAEDLLYHIKFHRAIALCGSIGSAKSFRKFIYDTYVEKATIERVEELVAEQAKRSEDESLTDEEIEMCLIIDDMGFNKKFMKHAAMGELASNGRQFKMATLVMVQYLIQMPTELRGNLDYVFFTREQSITNREKARMQYGGLCGGGASGQVVWNALMNASTKNRCVLVIDQTITDSTSVEDCYFWYQARWPMPKWKLGDKNYRDFHIARVRAAAQDPNSYVRYATAAVQKKRAQMTVKQAQKAAAAHKFVSPGSVKIHKLDATTIATNASVAAGATLAAAAASLAATKRNLKKPLTKPKTATQRKATTTTPMKVALTKLKQHIR
jgi:hypothetical protein